MNNRHEKTLKKTEMKVCLVSVDFLPNIGGIAAHVYELAKTLKSKGCEVTVLTSRRSIKEASCGEIDGVKVLRTYMPKKIKPLSFTLYMLQTWLKLRKIVNKKEADVVHTHNLIDAVPAILCGRVPVIETEHSSNFLATVEKNKRWKIRLHQHVMNSCVHVIGPSKELADTFIKIGVDREKVLYIPNGVDASKFNPKISGQTVKDKHGIKEDFKVVLCPRRLDPKNGVIYFIKAVPQILDKVKNVVFVVAGDGPEMHNIKEEARKLGVEENIIFAGRISNIDMPNYYAAADVVVLPSLKEATSIAGLEAMASGKPLVGTNVGGIPQIISEGETGLIVPPKNPEALAEAVVEILKDDELRKNMGLNARKKVEEEFSWNIITEKTLQVYSEALKKTKQMKNQSFI